MFIIYENYFFIELFMKKKKILVIGSSNTIIKLTEKMFNKQDHLVRINFKKAWKCQITKKYDEIIVSGFDFYICECGKKDILSYIQKYHLFLKKLKRKSKRIILISTFLDIKYSFCRVVYFYYKLIRCFNLMEDKKIQIMHFRKIIIIDNLKSKLLKKVIKFLKLEYIESVTRKYEKYKLIKLNKINFYLIWVPRTRLIDRILRLI
jgi:hypothetical protein